MSDEPRDWGLEMQRAAEAHLAACWEAEDSDAEDSPAVGPFDGCDTCSIREILASVWPLIEEFALSAASRITRALDEAPRHLHSVAPGEGSPSRVWSLEGFEDLPDNCFIGACGNVEATWTPIWLSDGSLTKSCREHSHAILAVLQAQAQRQYQASEQGQS